MAQYILEKGYKNDQSIVKVKLLLIHFEDENNIQFIYSSHLDLTGYGDSISDAKNSFEIALEFFAAMNK